MFFLLLSLSSPSSSSQLYIFSPKVPQSPLCIIFFSFSHLVRVRISNAADIFPSHSDAWHSTPRTHTSDLRHSYDILFPFFVFAITILPVALVSESSFHFLCYQTSCSRTASQASFSISIFSFFFFFSRSRIPPFARLKLVSYNGLPLYFCLLFLKTYLDTTTSTCIHIHPSYLCLFYPLFCFCKYCLLESPPVLPHTYIRMS